MPLGDTIAIIGGELVGIELAEFLHERGRTVTVPVRVTLLSGDDRVEQPVPSERLLTGDRPEPTYLVTKL